MSLSNTSSQKTCASAGRRKWPAMIASSAGMRARSVFCKMAQAMVSVNPVFLGSWLEALRPVRGHLLAPLAAIYRDTDRPASELLLKLHEQLGAGRDGTGINRWHAIGHPERRA